MSWHGEIPEARFGDLLGVAIQVFPAEMRSPYYTILAEQPQSGVRYSTGGERAPSLR